MKKGLSIILSLFLVLSIVTGCSKSDTKKYDQESDLLVIGGGGAGLAAALEASYSGVKNIIVVEKMGQIGGTTFISQGMIAGYDTEVQKEDNSVPTTYEEMYNNLMSNASYRLDKDLTKITVKQSKDTINWLRDKIKVPFQKDVLVGYGPLEMMHVVEGGGQGMLDPFTQALEAQNVKVLTNTSATELIMNADGSVGGAICKTADGEITIGAKAVVIATGGYANNPELTELLDPEFKGTYGIGFAGSTGDGIIMASNVGAALTHTSHLMAVLKDYEIMKDHNGTSNSATVSRLIAQTNTVLVGKNGKRFVDEKSGGYMTQELNSPIFDQMHKDGLGYVWAINDKQTLEANGIKRGANLEYITANTVAELAEKMGVDPKSLEETITNYNKYVEQNNDPEFSRKVMTKLTAPYIAVAVVPCEIITYGGVARNEFSEVIRADKSIINGLYVAGEAAANSAYMGFTISNAFTWGRIAGSNAADFILGNPKKPSTIEKEEVEESKVRFDMNTPIKDGEYETSVDGQEGVLKVKTTIKDGKISNVEILEQHETEAIAKGALEKMPTDIVSKNSVDIDVVSGATLSSNRIMDAVALALKEASK